MGGLGFDSGGGGTAYDSKTQQYFYTVSPKNSFSGGKEGRGSNCCSRPHIVGIYMLCLIVAHGQGRGVRPPRAAQSNERQIGRQNKYFK